MVDGVECRRDNKAKCRAIINNEAYTYTELIRSADKLFRAVDGINKTIAPARLEALAERQDRLPRSR